MRIPAVLVSVVVKKLTPQSYMILYLVLGNNNSPPIENIATSPYTSQVHKCLSGKFKCQLCLSCLSYLSCLYCLSCLSCLWYTIFLPNDMLEKMQSLNGRICREVECCTQASRVRSCLISFNLQCACVGKLAVI